MRGKQLAASFAIGPTAAVLLLAGSAAAAPAIPPATARPSGGTVQLLDYTDNDAAATNVIITGVIGDLGTATSVSPDGTISPDHGELNVALSHGSFRIDIRALDSAFLGAVSQAPFYPSNNTCSGSVSATDVAPIVPGSGTGAYRGIGGTFTLTITAGEVDARTADPASPCNATGALLGETIFTTGPGTISFH